MPTPHRHRRERHLATLLAAVIALTGVISAARPADVSAAASVTALAPHGPGPLAVGRPYLTNATTTWTVTRSGDGNEIVIEVDDPGNDLNDWHIGLAAPAGAALAVGTYADAQYPADSTHPNLELRHHDPTCSPIVGQFTILALTVDGTGHVTSLAATLEHGCYYVDAPRDYLDIRYASTVALRALDTTPAALTFDPTLVGHASTPKATTVQAKGTAATTVSSATISGPDASDFAISANACVGAHDPGSAACDIAVQFTPSATGPRHADLVIHDDAYPGTHTIALNASGYPFGVSTTSLDFGSHLLDTTTSKTVTLTNGDQTTNLGEIQFDVIEGGNPFSARPNLGCTALASLAANATCDLTVDFVPHTAATWSTGFQWFVGVDRVVVLTTGVSVPTTGVVWGTRKTVRDRAWMSSDALARSTRTSPSAAYLHLAFTSDLYGGRYANNTSPKLGVYYRRSSNGGSTWSTPKRINPTTKHADRAAVAATGSRVYFAYVTQTKWVNYSRTAPRVLYVRRNTSYGSSTAWKTAKRLTSLTGRVDDPSIAATSKHVYVAYTNASTGTVKVAMSHDKGVTWSTKALGSTTNATSDGKTGAPSVSANGSLIVVAWTADASGRVIARVSTNAGATWSTTTLTTTAASYATTGAAAGRLSVAWTTADGATVRTWRPSTWGSAVNLVPPGAPGTYEWFITPSITLSGTGLTGLAWSGCRESCDTDAVHMDLLWSESTDGGTTFPHRQVAVDSSLGGTAPANWVPSPLYGSATKRYMVYESDSFTFSSFHIIMKTGTGTP